MARKKAGRAKGSGTVFRDGHLYRARWVVGGKVFTRATGESKKDAALRKLEEFVRPYMAKQDAARMEGALVQLQGKRAEIAAWEDAQPALILANAWTAYEQSTSRPRSGEATMRNYRQWFTLFVDWVRFNYPEAKELRNVSTGIAREYAAALMSGTSQETRRAIEAARTFLHYTEAEKPRGEAVAELNAARRTLAGFAWSDPTPTADAPETRKARALVALKVRDPVRGTTFNRHVNALALVWRHVAADCPEARLGANPFSWDKSAGTGIRRVVLKHGERPHKRRDLTLQEVYQLLTAAHGEMRVLIALGFYTGLRLGDCALLDWGGVDWANKVISARSRKTDTETDHRINPALARIIEDEVKTDTGYLMPELAALYNGGTTGRVKLNRRVSDLFASIGIKTSYKAEGDVRARPDCGFHSLRHTFVTQLARVGVTMRERQALAGHNTAAMTAYYTHEDGAGALALPDLTEKPSESTEGAPSSQGAISAEVVPNATDVRFRAFCDALDGLTREQLEAAKAEIEQRIAATVNAETMTKTNAVTRTVEM